MYYGKTHTQPLGRNVSFRKSPYSSNSITASNIDVFNAKVDIISIYSYFRNREIILYYSVLLRYYPIVVNTLYIEMLNKNSYGIDKACWLSLFLTTILYNCSARLVIV